MASLSKSLRLMHILETVSELKVAIPSEILKRVAARAQADAEDPNFKRNIYRDLAELANDGRLSVRYLTPDGSELTPDEAEGHPNLRLEYTLNSAATPARGVRGIGAVEELGGNFLPCALTSLDWSFCSVENLSLPNRLTLIFEGKMNRYMALQLPWDQTPAHLLFSRLPSGHSNLKPFAAELEKTLGPRAAAFFVWDRSISRYDLESKLGHCVLSVTAEGKLRLKDLKSSSGTGWAMLDSTQLKNLEQAIRFQKSGSTQILEADPFHSHFAGMKLGADESEITPPCLIQMGRFRVIVYC